MTRICERATFEGQLDRIALCAKANRAGATVHRTIWILVPVLSEVAYRALKTALRIKVMV